MLFRFAHFPGELFPARRLLAARNGNWRIMRIYLVYFNKRPNICIKKVVCIMAVGVRRVRRLNFNRDWISKEVDVCLGLGRSMKELKSWHWDVWFTEWRLGIAYIDFIRFVVRMNISRNCWFVSLCLVSINFNNFQQGVDSIFILFLTYRCFVQSQRCLAAEKLIIAWKILGENFLLL